MLVSRQLVGQLHTKRRLSATRQAPHQHLEGVGYMTQEGGEGFGQHDLRYKRPALAEIKQAQIHKLFAEGVSMNQISKRIGVAYGTVYNYVQKSKAAAKLSR